MQYLFIAINSEKTTVENEKENLTERLSQLDEEVKKVKKDLQESREKLKRSDEVRYSVFVFERLIFIISLERLNTIV